MMRAVLALLVLAVATPAALAASGASFEAAQAAVDPVQEEQVRRLAAELRCPVCQGLSIQDSPTELSNEMKAVIRDQLALGKTPDEVKAYFVSKYGEWILLEPKPSGFNLAVYLLPVFGLLGGGAFVAFFVRRMVRPAAAEDAPERELVG
jgi:cytochrome c-type biogenesis protein CcmH